ncbi:MAG: peptidoglycan-binding domain-containing protein [Patescibacteria group bacterium]
MNLKSKLFASAVAFSMVLGAVAIPASAATTAELTAQINALLAQIAQLQAQIGGGSVVAGTTFTTDLTVGSRGPGVTALQQWLVGKGLLTMPAGVAYGYFGNLTKAAVAAYQTSVGITPAVGYFGPITRAKVNATVVVTPPVTPPGTVVPVGAITTPGAEGTIAATESSAGTVSTVYEGDSQAPILGIKVEATGSDMAVQRIKFDLDEDVTASDTKFYNKIYKKLYITEGGNVLASIDLNSSTVTKDGSDYFVTIAGFNSVVPKGSSKIYLIKADVYGAIDSADYNTETYTIAVAASGVRAVDGAGIDQYSGTTAIAATPTVAATLSDSATLTISLNSSTPKKTDAVCTGGSSENECDKLSVLVFDMKAEKDSAKITDMNIAVAKAGTGGATASTTVYLYEGSTLLANATVGSLNTAVFSDLDYTIAKDVTKTFTVKVDIRNANKTISNFTASASSTGITDENSVGDSVTDSGTATGNQVGVLSVGPEFTLVSKSITTNGVPQDNVSGTASISTSTITATFNIKVKAVGAALVFGTTQATSTTGAFVSSTTGFTVFKNGSSDATISSNATSTSITFPSTCTTSGYTNSCQLAEGSDVTVPVSFQLQGRTTASTVFSPGLYSFGIAQLNWVYDNSAGGTYGTTFMSGEADWRTSEVSFP